MNTEHTNTPNVNSSCCAGGACSPVTGASFSRREFLATNVKAGLFVSAWAGLSRPMMAGAADADNPYLRVIPADKKLDPAWVKSLFERGEKGVYRSQAAMQHIGMPVGGIFAGTVYLSADGRLWHWDVLNAEAYGIAPKPFVHEGRPRKSNHGAHYAFPLEPVSPFRQGFVIRTGGKEITLDKTGFKEVTFRGEYPRAIVSFEKADLPVSASLEAFSPFIPLNPDDSELPATVMHYTVKNEGTEAIDVEVVGFLENAACLYSRTVQSGTIHNRVVKGAGFTGVECSVQSLKRPSGEAGGREDVVFESFDPSATERWKGKGTAFAEGPFRNGKTVVDTYTGSGRRDQRTARLTGVLKGKPFKVERNYITAEISGEFDPELCGLFLVIGGKVAARVTGNNRKQHTLATMDVSEFIGSEAYLEIRDGAVEINDHILNPAGIAVGKIVFTDTPGDDFGKLEALPDFGTMTLALLGQTDQASAVKGKKVVQAEDKLGAILEGEVGRSVSLAAGQEATFTFVVSWYFPNYRNTKMPRDQAGRHYGSRFKSSTEVATYLSGNFERLASATRQWVDTWYDSSLPYWFLDRTMANTSTMATTTCQRFESGRFWAWEGVACCSGTCSHVWQYAQSIARLFPGIERETRDKVDFTIGFEKMNGGVGHRIDVDTSIVADDGQLGRILSVYREHQMSADDAFLKAMWPRVKKALEFIISQDEDLDGVMTNAQRNTLDGEWHGKISWIISLYIAGLRATEQMAIEMGDSAYAARCKKIADSGARKIDELFDGEYSTQDKGERTDTAGNGPGCFIDQIFGQSWANWVGLGHIINKDHVASSLRALYRYNFAPDMGVFRKEWPHGRIYALAGDAGLVMCTWPKGGKDEKDNHVYFHEMMSGFEWQAASNMIYEGLDHPELLEHGLAVSRAIHDRYNGEHRNPYNEIECGDHYGRAMASYGAFQSICGYQYHGPKGELSFAPRLKPEDFRAAFTTAEGWGSFSQKVVDGRQSAEIDLRYGTLALKRFSCGQVAGTRANGVSIQIDGKPIAAGFGSEGGHYIAIFDAAVTLKAGQRMEVSFV